MNSNRKLNLLKFGQSSLLLASLILPAVIKPIETKAKFIFTTKTGGGSRNSTQGNNQRYTVNNWFGPNGMQVGNIRNTSTGSTDWYSTYDATGVGPLQPGPHNALVPYVAHPLIRRLNRSGALTTSDSSAPATPSRPIPLPSNDPEFVGRILRQAGDTIHDRHTGSSTD